MVLMFFNPYLALDAKRAQIDKQICVLEEQTNQLKRHRNALSPAVRLPPELLSQIFLTLRDDFHTKAEKASSSHDWMVVAFVCHHWREVALSTCALWSRINLARVKSDEHGLTLLSRAHQVPLRVQLDLTSSSKTGERLLRQLSASMEHMQELNLVGHLTPAKGHQYQPFLTSSAPSLKSLRIENTAFLGHGAVSVPAHLITSAPRLHNISLSGCHISLSRGNFQSLKEMSLKSCILGGLNDVLEALASMAQLRCLEVSNVTFADNLSAADLLPAHLPNLERLDMSGCLRYCSKLARYLITPNATRWRLSATSLDGLTHLEDLVEYARRFRGVLRSKGHHLSRAAIVRHSGFCTNSVAASWSESSKEHDVYVEVRDAEHDWAGPICAALGVSDAKLVDAYGAARDVFSAWGDRSLVANVETLVVRDDGRSRSTLALTDDQVSYPHLRTLIILEQQYGPGHFPALVEWVHQRKQRNQPISQLILRGSKRWHSRHFPATMLQKLREAIVVVRAEELKEAVSTFIQLSEMGYVCS